MNRRSVIIWWIWIPPDPVSYSAVVCAVTVVTNNSSSSGAG